MCSFLWLSNILLYICTTGSFLIFQVTLMMAALNFGYSACHQVERNCLCWCQYVNLLYICKIHSLSFSVCFGPSTSALPCPPSSCKNGCAYQFYVFMHSVTQSCLTLRTHELQPARLLCPWDFPGKKFGVGCHFLLQGYIYVPRAYKPMHVHTYIFIITSELHRYAGIFWLCCKTWIEEVFEQLQGKFGQIILLQGHLQTEFISLVSVISLL